MCPTDRPGNLAQRSTAFALVLLCRCGYLVNLLSFKFPLGLLVRASWARFVLAFLCLAVLPFFVYCHAVLLPGLRIASNGLAVWHLLVATWVTIPLSIVGIVIFTRARGRRECMGFLCALAAVALFHLFGVVALQPSRFGTALLQIMFVFFEDLPVAAWAWCLFHVVGLQDLILRRQTLRGRACDSLVNSCENSITEPRESSDRVLIVGNAPTVTSGEPLGAEMDGFPSVVRFNDYSTCRPEFTGSRMDYHFCNDRQVAGVPEKSVLPLFNSSLTHAAYFFFPHMEEAGEIVANLARLKTNTWIVDEARLLALRRKIGLWFWQVPSSGMVAIDAFLAKHPRVVLHGFDFFEGKHIHYFEETPAQLVTSWLELFVTHSPAREKSWVARLVSRGRVTFLAEDAAMHAGGALEGLTTEMDGDGKKKQARRRPRGLLGTILADGFPSQFSI